MSTAASIPIAEAPGRVPSANGWGRVAAIGEVMLAFAVVHVTYRALKHFTVMGKWDEAANFIPGAVMIVATVVVLLVCRRNFEAYGLSVKRWRHDLSLGLVCSLLLNVILAIGLVMTGIHFEAGRPPDPHAPHQFARIAGFAAIILPGWLAVIALFRTKGRGAERIPPAVSVPAIIALVALLPLVAAHFHRPAMWSQALWLFLGAGFGEEIFFRGYLQSRVDQAFGCPWSLGGIAFGPGLVVSSLLFGLVHALNTVDYFHGRFDFGWSMGLQSVGVGIFYGCIRAKTGSVLTGAIIHGLSDNFLRIPQLLP